ncbi:MAG: AbrB/MazE/SpoVT family DNA-binding domain-containing protein [Defluviitaleaceae bacterium]|nr:AbrB/MazE/SpoVT family DNA-binding domain-containing protein [Defluviitaleaceae bacterium]
MERHNTRRIDQQSKMTLPSALRRDLSLNEKAQVSLMPVESIVILWRLDGEPSSHCYTSTIDDLGRVEIPAEIMHQLNWQLESEISLYATDNLVILKSV